MLSILFLIYFFFLLVFAVLTYAVSFHYLKFRFAGDGSLIFLFIFLAYSAAVILSSFLLLFI